MSRRNNDFLKTWWPEEGPIERERCFADRDEGKIKYANQVIAEREARKTESRYDVRLDVYRCDYCGAWHFTRA